MLAIKIIINPGPLTKMQGLGFSYPQGELSTSDMLGAGQVLPGDGWMGDWMKVPDAPATKERRT